MKIIITYIFIYEIIKYLFIILKYLSVNLYIKIDLNRYYKHIYNEIPI